MILKIYQIRKKILKGRNWHPHFNENSQGFWIKKNERFDSWLIYRTSRTLVHSLLYYSGFFVLIPSYIAYIKTQNQTCLPCNIPIFGNVIPVLKSALGLALQFTFTIADIFHVSNLGCSIVMKSARAKPNQPLLCKSKRKKECIFKCAFHSI